MHVVDPQLEQVEDDVDAQRTLLQQAKMRSVAELQKQLRETQEHLQRYRLHTSIVTHVYIHEVLVFDGDAGHDNLA
jgi:multidrug efflux pump subunit AcrA (membrane-fusion protein)